MQRLACSRAEQVRSVQRSMPPMLGMIHATFRGFYGLRFKVEGYLLLSGTGILEGLYKASKATIQKYIGFRA